MTGDVKEDKYGVMIEEEGLTLRGTFIIDPDGNLKTIEIHDNSIGRDMDELLRKLQAAQFVNKYGDQVFELKNDIELLNTSLKDLNAKYNKLENLDRVVIHANANYFEKFVNVFFRTLLQ